MGEEEALAKERETKTETLKIRLTPTIKEQAKEIAYNKGISLTEYLTFLIMQGIGKSETTLELRLKKVETELAKLSKVITRMDDNIEWE